MTFDRCWKKNLEIFHVLKELFWKFSLCFYYFSRFSFSFCWFFRIFSTKKRNLEAWRGAVRLSASARRFRRLARLLDLASCCSTPLKSHDGLTGVGSSRLSSNWGHVELGRCLAWVTLGRMCRHIVLSDGSKLFSCDSIWFSSYKV